MKRILMRIIGALCILGAAALMFFPNWMTIDGISRKDMRKVRNDVVGITETVSESFAERVKASEDFKDDLRDNDLPYTRATIKKRFKTIGNLAAELMNDTISLKEVTQTAFLLPGVLKDAENLLDSDARTMLFSQAANYVVYSGSEPIPDADGDYVSELADAMDEMVEGAVDGLAGYSIIFIAVGALFVLILLLAVASAVTHVCNKGRWLKYLFLVVLVAMVAGSCVGISFASDMLPEMFAGMPLMENASLRISVMPFLAVAVMFMPIVLDVIYERKNEQKKVEDQADGKQ